MSTSIAYTIPLDKKYIPDKKLSGEILKLISKRNRYNLKIEIEKNDDIRFYDCGEDKASLVKGRWPSTKTGIILSCDTVLY